jgi:ribosomal protein S18 acetylase RimI-like enzyme
MKYKIRNAAEGDIAGLGDIERAADRLFPAGRIPSSDSTYPLEGFTRALREGLLLVAEVEPVDHEPVDHRVVGFAVAWEAENALHLGGLAVHPDYGRRGIGRDLVVAVIAESARRGLAGVTLTTFEDLKWNGPFYAQLGFRTLAPPETSSMLAAILSSEAAAGMRQRVAMLYRNA